MTTWSYRVIQFPNHIGLYAVFYATEGGIISRSELPIVSVPPEDGVDALWAELDLMVVGAKTRPLLTPGDFPPEQPAPMYDLDEMNKSDEP